MLLIFRHLSRQVSTWKNREKSYAWFVLYTDRFKIFFAYLNQPLKYLIIFQTYFFTAESSYAPSVSYQRLFLKRMLKLCEDRCIEIADELYEAYGDVCGKAEHLDNKCFKTYVLVRFIQKSIGDNHQKRKISIQPHAILKQSLGPRGNLFLSWG